MNPVYAVFSRHAAAVTLAADPPLIEEIAGLMRPFVQVEQVAAPPADQWAVAARRDYAPGPLTLERTVEDAPGEPQRVALVDRQARWIVHTYEQPQWMMQNTLRMIRNLLRVQLYAAGALFLHGAMIDVGGCGIAYLGRKRAGKTSSLLAALAHPQVALVNNDDLTVLPGQTPRGLGWPRAVGVHFDTVEAVAPALPALRQATQQLTHPVNFIDTPDRYYFYPTELARLCGRDLRPETALRMIVFPCFLPRGTSGVELERLDPARALELLTLHTEPVPDKYNRFLHDYFVFPTSAMISQQLRDLVARVPCYELRQSFDCLVAGAQRLIDQVLPEAAW